MQTEFSKGGRVGWMQQNRPGKSNQTIMMGAHTALKTLKEKHINLIHWSYPLYTV